MRSVRRDRAMRPLTLCLALILSFTAIGGLTGCSSPGGGFFQQSQQAYTINVFGTAIGTNSLVLHTTVTLTVE